MYCTETINSNACDICLFKVWEHEFFNGVVYSLHMN